MSARSAIACLLLTLVALAAGCSTARPVYLDGGGGVVAMPFNTEGNRAKAFEIMRAHCPNGFEILHEEEVPVGTVTSTTAGAEPTQTGGVAGGSTTTTTTQTEWRITFRCRS